MDDLKLYAESEKDRETLVHTTSMFCNDIKMKFGLYKCASIKIAKGNKAVFNGISLPNGDQIDGLDDEGHDKVSAVVEVHWSLCNEYGFDHSSKWYEHRAEKVLENNDVKLLWHFHVQSDHVIEHCRPDLLLVKKEAVVIDIAVPGDVRISDKEQDKILKYQDLKREIKSVWQLMKVTVVPIVIGALGTVAPIFRGCHDSVSCKLRVSNLQKTALLGPAHILRKVLEI
ncbi:hypothetical protein ACHWQZ_G009445 [Mnemiopsis leidyi]